jgi:tRNA (guanosine-2'-O-)-methyltransferase
MIPKNRLQETFDYLKQFLTDERLSKIEHFSQESSDFVLPVMEDVYQFRNAAAIVRSVEACGFHHVVALEEENVFNPNLKVTKGAETWVQVEKMPNNLDSLKEIKSRGYRILAVSPINLTPATIRVFAGCALPKRAISRESETQPPVSSAKA